MNMSTWSIRHPVPPIAIFLVLVIIGLVSFRSLPVTNMPNIDLPIVTVSVAQPGAAPSEIATQVIQPIEDAIYGLTGVRHISSIAMDSAAQVTVEFELEVDSDRALNDVKDVVSNVRDDLPEGTMEPLVRRVDVVGRPILTYAVRDSSRTVEELARFVDDVVERAMANVEGVGKVERVGGAEREIEVELDPDRLLAHGLTASEISNQLRAANIDLGGGRGDLAGTEYAIRTLGSAATIADLAATPIAIANGQTIRLDQLGTVTDGASEERSFALLDSNPVVSFAVFRASGKSDLTAATATKAKIDALRARYPSVSIEQIDDTTHETESSYHNAMDTLLEGAILSVVVVFLFLRNWRATLIAAVALPLSIIPTFFVMDWLGFTLNGISLLGITLVTGILVDDAIVEIENIVRHINMGLPAYEASEEAATEIGLTVIAISFSIVAVFAPVSFMPGIPGQYFKQFGLTVAVSVLFSLLVARIITPMLAAYFMRGKVHEETSDGFLMRRFMRILGWTLRHRVLTLILGIAVFAGSIYSATLIPTEFIPEEDIGRLNVEVEVAPGATISEMQSTARTVSRMISETEEVKSVFVDGGSSSVTNANFTVNLGTFEERVRDQFTIEDEVEARLRDLPDVRVQLLNAQGASDVTISVLADDITSLRQASDMFLDQMRNMEGLTNLSSSASLERPEIRVIPKADVARQLGVTSSALATTLRVATLGDSESNLAKFNAGDQQVPIVVRLEQAAREDLRRIESLRVPSSAGPVPLAAVADVTFAQGATTINRYDRRYRTTISANLQDGYLLGPVTEKISAMTAEMQLPEGTEVQASGDAEIMAEVFGSFGIAMGAGILLVYVVLTLLFHNFVTPISILLSLPLAIGGAILALFVTDNSMSLSVVIGFLMLMGIVTKNAIMLVEFALTAMAEGVSKADAILDAAHKRARPIIMTTIAMTAGMVPAAMATGAGAAFRAPMAIAVIGGLLLSTVLTLLFIPSLFSLIHGASGRVTRLVSRVIGLNKSRHAT